MLIAFFLHINNKFHVSKYCTNINVNVNVNINVNVNLVQILFIQCKDFNLIL